MGRKPKKKSSSKKEEESSIPLKNRIHEHTGVSSDSLYAIVAIIFFALSVFLTLAYFHKAGLAGSYLRQTLSTLIGSTYMLFPTLITAMAVLLLRRTTKGILITKLVGITLLFLSFIIGFDILTHRGGTLGNAASAPLVAFFDIYASLLVLAVTMLISLYMLFDTKISPWYLKEKLQALSSRIRGTEKPLPDMEGIKVEGGMPLEESEVGEEAVLAAAATDAATAASLAPGDAALPKIHTPPPPPSKDGVYFKEPAVLEKDGYVYVPPPLSLLKYDRGKPGVGDIKANANIIKRTLQNFNITVEVEEISIGPSITRYALKPAEGVKLSRIVGLQNDLALALAAHPVRVEAPIPGRSLVGIEIPNSTKTTVGLGSMLASEEYQSTDKPLLVSLGRGISGKSHFANLAKMPHCLIAGATGAGKSVTIHSVITSLLFKNAPDNLRFIMIDPKRVELTLYNEIPHLLTPVITQAKEAILALKWAAKEMDRRYDIFEAEKVRDIDSYHKNVYEPAFKKYEASKEGEHGEKPTRMPYIVIIIDELADIMQTYPRELEAAIVRIAQMSRAVGIHLILSTQRPSVNVITGLIKANVPARIALQVASQIDSRTILDTGGAEKLLGAGDMLYLSGEMSKPVRLQSAFISEGELKDVVNFLKKQSGYEEAPTLSLSESPEGGKNTLFEAIKSEDDADGDELYEQAREIVIGAGKASTSFLQRKLRIGYARAARLMDILEERGIIGPPDGSKPRSVLGAVTVRSDDGELPPIQESQESDPIY